MDLREYRTKNKKFTRHPWELARANIVKKILLRYYPKDTANILDIGTGDGYSLSQIYNTFKKSKAIGLDISLSKKEEDELNKTFQKFDITATREKQKALNFAKENKIDIVCLMDVLEHIEEDSAFLADLIKEYNLTSSSYFLITVPAFNQVFSRHDEAMKHYRRYTKNSLTKILKQNNLEILETGYFFSSLLCVRALICIKDKLIKPHKALKNTANWSYGPNLAKIVKTVLMMDFYFNQFLKKLSIDLPGLSIYALVKGVK